jgi:hypothetical protein
LAKDSPESLPGQPGEGRPRNSKDTEQRKEKTFKPRTGASLTIWANEAQDKISEIINPIMLSFYNKKNLRSLSNEETKELEQTKTKILFSYLPFAIISEENVMSAMSNLNKNEHNKVLETYLSYVKSINNDLNRQLSVDEQKQAKASFYTMVYSNNT